MNIICAALVGVFIGLFMAAAGNWWLLITCALVATGAYFWLGRASQQAAADDPQLQEDLHRWMMQVRCTRCDQVFYDPGHPDRRPGDTHLFDAQHALIGQWRREKAALWTGNRPRASTPEWCGTGGDGSSAHAQALLTGQPLPPYPR